MKDGKLIEEYPIERYIPLLNHTKVLFGLDELEERVTPWEIYSIETALGVCVCEAVLQTLCTVTGEDVIINFLDYHSEVENGGSVSGW